MGYYATCDVKGCDEICQLDGFGQHPSDWYGVHFEVDADERTQALAEAAQRGMLPTRPILTDADGSVSDETLPTMRISRSVLMCPNHDMPEFDPEPTSAWAQTQLIGGHRR